MSGPSNDQSGGSADARDGEGADRVLDSWKEIADFLGVSVRTAHRWKEETGMPTHRAPSGHVYARTVELERWRRGRPRRPARWLILAALTLLSTGVTLFLFRPWQSLAVGVPAAVRFEGQTVVALDENGRSIWTVATTYVGFADNAGWEVSKPDRSLVADVDEDGDVEVLVNVLDGDAEGPGRIVCYSRGGRVRWEFVPGARVEDSHGEYPRRYAGHILRAARVRGKQYVLSIAAHRLWHPSQVALLDPSTGTIVEEFWHPGAITHARLADLDHDGAEELVLAGLNNPGPGSGSPVLMVLRLPFSLAAPTPGSLMADLSDGGPIAYVAFPRSDVLSAQGGTAAIVTVVFEEPDALVVQLRYARDKPATLTYRLDASLHLMHASLDSLYLQAVHDTLWRAGTLDHPFSRLEGKWLQVVRPFAHVPDGSTALVPPFRPAR